MADWQKFDTAPRDRPFLGGGWKKGAWVTEIVQWHEFSSDWARFAAVRGKHVLVGLTHWMPLPEPPQ